MSCISADLFFLYFQIVWNLKGWSENNGGLMVMSGTFFFYFKEDETIHNDDLKDFFCQH